MKIESQVCTLEQAKRLKELGVNQFSLFRFVGTSNEDISTDNIKISTGYEWTDYPGYGLYPVSYAAYNVAELGVMHDCFSGGENDFYPTEAQARAQWLIIALEKGWTTSSKVNERFIAA